MLSAKSARPLYSPTPYSQGEQKELQIQIVYPVQGQFSPSDTVPKVSQGKS